jgi:hypothetical protein
MTSWAEGLSERTRFGLLILALAPILALLVLLIALPPDGSERAEWAQFIGRFHPMAVHLPIALILLVPVFELAGRHRHGRARMVSCAQWWLFRAAGDTTYVGWVGAIGILLYMLDLAGARRGRTGPTAVPHRTRDNYRGDDLDRLSRRATCAGRGPPH